MADITRLFKPRELLTIALFAITLIASSILLYQQAMDNRQETLENQGYLRFMACVMEVRNARNALTIGLDDAEKCHAIAEQQVGVKLQRYIDLINK